MKLSKNALRDTTTAALQSAYDAGRSAGRDEALREATTDVDRLQVQLAGCGVAALGGTSPEQVATREMYGWSPSYQDVLDLRLRYEGFREFVQQVFDDRGCDCMEEPFALPKVRCSCSKDECWKCSAAELLGWPGVEDG